MISGICLTTKAPLRGHPKGMKLNIAIATLLKMPYNTQGSFTKFPSKKGKMRKKNKNKDVFLTTSKHYDDK